MKAPEESKQSEKPEVQTPEIVPHLTANAIKEGGLPHAAAHAIKEGGLPK